MTTEALSSVTTGVLSSTQILFVIAAAFGGFVDGLIKSRSYSLRWGKSTIDIGSLGDCLVGAAAGLSIFTVATCSLFSELNELNVKHCACNHFKEWLQCALHYRRVAQLVRAPP